MLNSGKKIRALHDKKKNSNSCAKWSVPYQERKFFKDLSLL